MSQTPLFTFIIPTFNPGEKLALTIDSILAQSRGDVQIWVQDGGSTDQTVDYLQSRSGIEWQSAPDAGLYDAMNRGITQARGSWLVFYGAGDILSEGALDNLRPIVLRHADQPTIVYGDTWFCQDNKRRGHTYSPLHLRKDMPCHQSTLYQRQIFDLVGNYNIHYTVSADYAFGIICWGDKRIRKVYEPILIGRYEGGGISSYTHDSTFYLGEHPKLLKTHLGTGVWLAQKVEDPFLTYVLKPSKKAVRAIQKKLKK